MYPVPVVGSTYICIYNIEIPPLTECVVMLNGSRLFSHILAKGKEVQCRILQLIVACGTGRNIYIDVHVAIKTAHTRTFVGALTEYMFLLFVLVTLQTLN
jgi:hypothetical protein